MLERMRGILERMDEIKDRCRELSGQKKLRPQVDQSFKKNLQQATPKASEVPGEPIKPAPAIFKPLAPRPTTLAPLPQIAPANPKPPDYTALIERHARLNNLDPKLVRRLIEVESNFDPSSISSKGAMGLMQLMPETAQGLGLENPFDPEQNISAGTKYLAKMLSQENGNVARALAAYNAGPTAVREYGGIPPFPETRNYVKKILGSLPKNEESSEE